MVTDMKIEKITYSSLNSWAAQYLIDRIEKQPAYYPYISLRQLIQRSKEKIKLDPNTQYKQVTIRTNFMGASLRSIKLGTEIKTKTQYVIQEGQLLVSKIDARNGACAIVPSELAGAIVTTNFWAFYVDESVVRSNYILAFLSTKSFLDFAEKTSNGSTGRHYLQENIFLDFSIPLPSLNEQDSILKQYYDIIDKWKTNKTQISLQKRNIWYYVQKKIGIENHIFKYRDFCSEPIVYHFSDMQSWNVNDMNFFQKFNSYLYPTSTLTEQMSNIKLLQKGKNPKYLSHSPSKIINQKCVREGYVDIQFAKGVDPEWVSKYPEKILTKKGDILICSTGNGTIGRAALIDSDCEGLLYDSHVILLRLDEKLISPIFLCYLINSTYVQEQVDYLKTARTTNQTELGITNLLKIKIPLPPIKKQNLLTIKIKKTNSNFVEYSFAEQIMQAAQLLETLLYKQICK